MKEITRGMIMEDFYSFSDWVSNRYRSDERPTLMAATIEASPEDHSSDLNEHPFGLRVGVLLAVADGEDYNATDWTLYDTSKSPFLQVDSFLTYDETLPLLVQAAKIKRGPSKRKRGPSKPKSNVTKAQASRALTAEEARWIKRAARVFADRPPSLEVQAGEDSLILLDRESFNRDEPDLWFSEPYQLAHIELGTTLCVRGR